MIDKIISALESMEEDMEDHGKTEMAKGVSSAIMLIGYMRDFADRKTEPSMWETPYAKAYADGYSDGANMVRECEADRKTEPSETMSCEECEYQNECEQVVVFDIGEESVTGHYLHYCSYGKRKADRKTEPTAGWTLVGALAICPNCGTVYERNSVMFDFGGHFAHYCPYCGAHMRESE